MGCGVSKDSVADHPRLVQSSKKRLIHKCKKEGNSKTDTVKSSFADRTISAEKTHDEPLLDELENTPPADAAVTVSPPRSHVQYNRHYPLKELPISSNGDQEDQPAAANKLFFSLRNVGSYMNQGKSRSPANNVFVDPLKRPTQLNPVVEIPRANNSFSPRQTAWAVNGVKKLLKPIDPTKKIVNGATITLAQKSAADIVLPRIATEGRETVVEQTGTENISVDEITVGMGAPSQATIVEPSEKESNGVKIKRAKDLVYRLKDVDTLKPIKSSRNASYDSDQMATLMAWSNISSSPSSYMKEHLEHLDQPTESVHLSTTPRHWSSVLGDSDIENLDLDIENISLEDDDENTSAGNDADYIRDGSSTTIRRESDELGDVLHDFTVEGISVYNCQQHLSV